MRMRTAAREGEEQMNRRAFLRSSSAAAFGLGMQAGLFDHSMQAQAQSRPDARWDPGSVIHILPQVSDTRMLIKASFDAPLQSEPSLRIGTTTVHGRMSDTRGELWQFHAAGLRAGERYSLSLTGSGGRSLCEP